MIWTLLEGTIFRYLLVKQNKHSHIKNRKDKKI